MKFNLRFLLIAGLCLALVNYVTAQEENDYENVLNYDEVSDNLVASGNEDEGEVEPDAYEEVNVDNVEHKAKAANPSMSGGARRKSGGGRKNSKLGGGKRNRNGRPARRNKKNAGRPKNTKNGRKRPRRNNNGR